MRTIKSTILVQIQLLWILYSESLVPKYEYMNFQTYFLSLQVNKKDE